jgi:hypothetical protein
MARSDIEICNVALSTLGQRSILSFDSGDYGDNALLCRNIYRRGHRFLLSRADWPFARSVAVLNKISEPQMAVEEGYAVYALPNLCVRPLGLKKPYNRTKWEVVSEGILAPDAGDDVDSYPRLIFTKEITDPTKFSEPFSELLVSYLVAKLAGPVAGLNPKETAYYNSIFFGQLDSLPAVELNASQGAQIDERDMDIDTFNQE